MTAPASIIRCHGCGYVADPADPYPFRCPGAGAGGRPLVVPEDALAEASRLATARTGIPVDPTGSSGLAGLTMMRRNGQIGDHDRVAVLFTGLRRNQ